MMRYAVGLLGVAAVVLGGCGGSAVLIGHTANGGILGLDGDHDQAMGDARRLMSELCDGAYTIVGQRRAVASVLRGRVIREDRIDYACGAAPDAPNR